MRLPLTLGLRPPLHPVGELFGALVEEPLRCGQTRVGGNAEVRRPIGTDAQVEAADGGSLDRHGNRAGHERDGGTRRFHGGHCSVPEEPVDLRGNQLT